MRNTFVLNYHINLVESRHFDFASDLPDFRGVAFPRVVRFLVDTSIRNKLVLHLGISAPYSSSCLIKYHTYGVLYLFIEIEHEFYNHKGNICIGSDSHII